MIRRQTRNKHSSSTYKMSKQHTSIVTVKLLPGEFRTDFEGEDIGFSMTEERAEELLNILHASFETANHKELSAKSAEYKKRIADNKAFREFQEKQRAKRPTMSVETSMAFGEEIDDLKRALDDQKTQNEKLMGIIESCVLTGKIVEERGVLIAAENLQLKKDLSTWEADCDKFYKEVLGLRDEVATAKALAADWEKKCNEAVYDQDAASEAHASEMKEKLEELEAARNEGDNHQAGYIRLLNERDELILAQVDLRQELDASAQAKEKLEAQVEALEAGWAAANYQAGYSAAEEKFRAEFQELRKCRADATAWEKEEIDRLRKDVRAHEARVAWHADMAKRDMEANVAKIQGLEALVADHVASVAELKEENEQLKAALAVKEKTTPTAVHYVELRSPVVEAPEPSPLALGTPAVHPHVPAEIPEEHSPFMARSEQLAEESDAILQLVTALREREESIAQYLGGSTKKSPNPEEH